MATAAQVLKAAFQKIIVQASESDLEADEYADAIFTLNNMMNSFAADGINLGFTEITTLADEVTIPSGALRGTIYNLAIELAPEYGGQVTPALAQIANDSLKSMRMSGVDTPVSSMPCTLPIGSGNESYSGRSSKFFAESEDAILTETTGSIGLESGTT